jgi:hypothetical protein
MMVNKNIFTVLLCTVGFLQSAENNSQRQTQHPGVQKIVLLAIEKQRTDNQMRVDIVLQRLDCPSEKDRADNSNFNPIIAGIALEQFLEKILITSKDEQVLAQERTKMFDLDNQKNRRNQNADYQKHAYISTKKQKKYNNGKHRNNSGR